MMTKIPPYQMWMEMIIYSKHDEIFQFRELVFLHFLQIDLNRLQKLFILPFQFRGLNKELLIIKGRSMSVWCCNFFFFQEIGAFHDFSTFSFKTIQFLSGNSHIHWCLYPKEKGYCVLILKITDVKQGKTISTPSPIKITKLNSFSIIFNNLSPPPPQSWGNVPYYQLQLSLGDFNTTTAIPPLLSNC